MSVFHCFVSLRLFLCSNTDLFDLSCTMEKRFESIFEQRKCRSTCTSAVWSGPSLLVPIYGIQSVRILDLFPRWSLIECWGPYSLLANSENWQTAWTCRLIWVYMSHMLYGCLLFEGSRLLILQSPVLTHLCLVNSSVSTLWSGPFSIQWVSGGFL